MKNLDNKVKILLENANNNGVDLAEYVMSEAESDCNFFRWLFDEDFENDFDSSLSDIQKIEYQEWLNALIINSKLNSIQKFFTERRLKCLSISTIEREAGIPNKSLDHFLKGRRSFNVELVESLVSVLKDFGYKS